MKIFWDVTSSILWAILLLTQLHDCGCFTLRERLPCTHIQIYTVFILQAY
jgi:hypothetical protein